ncbi:MAG TPA: glycerophosphodiester phosphodiesterase [Xanthobacteraceae bacterium]|nr:glycerophosphodiester phosphodiesterase [Xanthobacteraceae bacterium]
MKLIAHRGWAAGAEENTLAAFARAASDARLSGVEFDVNVTDVGTLVVSHDRPRPGQDVLTLDAALAFLSRTNLELFVEIKQPGLAAGVIGKLVAANLAGRSVVFAFAGVARTFPWQGARPVRLGIIVLFPWQIDRAMRAYAPDVLFLGWDYRAWTGTAFRAWWSVCSLEQRTRRCGVPIVVGIVHRMRDLAWLTRQRIYGGVADIDRTIAAAD